MEAGNFEVIFLSDCVTTDPETLVFTSEPLCVSPLIFLVFSLPGNKFKMPLGVLLVVFSTGCIDLAIDLASAVVVVVVIVFVVVVVVTGEVAVVIAGGVDACRFADGTGCAPARGLAGVQFDGLAAVVVVGANLFAVLLLSRSCVSLRVFRGEIVISFRSDARPFNALPRFCRDSLGTF
jgi:hypothetical protein